MAYGLRRNKRRWNSSAPALVPSVVKSLSRACYAAAVGLSAAGIAGWGVQQVLPERSRSWPLLRFANAAAALAALSLDYKLLGWWDMKACHRRSARRLVRLAERNRGVYVKVGQHASAMEYLLPLEYTQQLQQLQHNVPPSPTAQVEDVLKQELEVDRLDEVFLQFDEKPVGTASLAQVHFAVLTTGEPVAVKVQHADVRKLAAADTKVVEVLTKFAAKIFPEVRFEWLVDLLRENLPAELDFRKEAANAIRCRLLLQANNATFAFALPRPSAIRSFVLQKAATAVSSFWVTDSQHANVPKGAPSSLGATELSDVTPAAKPQESQTVQEEQFSASGTAAELQDVEAAQCCSEYEVELYVPSVYEKLTTARVLVMERCEGVPVDDLEGIVAQAIHPLAVSAALSELYGRLIFDLGFVHADPHPGNVLVHLKPWPQQAWTSQQQGQRPTSVLLSSLNGETMIQNAQTEREVLRKRGLLRLSLLDHGLYCSLSHEFRYTYARLWLAMQRGDITAVTACANEFGVGKLAGLLAVILSLRSEDSITSGLQLSRKSPEEATLLRRSFPEYFARITNVLQEVPHELILLIKTYSDLNI